MELILISAMTTERVIGNARGLPWKIPEEYEHFLRDVGPFESLLLDSGIQLVKFYLDISKDEQIRRLESRRSDPLKQWKSSPIDAVAVELWDDYSEARDQMLESTHTPAAPWNIVLADNKRRARINVLRHLLRTLQNSRAEESVESPDPDVVFAYEPGLHAQLAR